jgi:hypothetical protein
LVSEKPNEVLLFSQVYGNSYHCLKTEVKTFRVAFTRRTCGTWRCFLAQARVYRLEAESSERDSPYSSDTGVVVARLQSRSPWSQITGIIACLLLTIVLTPTRKTKAEFAA